MVVPWRFRDSFSLMKAAPGWLLPVFWLVSGGQLLEAARSSRGNEALHMEVGIELNVGVKVTRQ